MAYMYTLHNVMAHYNTTIQTNDFACVITARMQMYSNLEHVHAFMIIIMINCETSRYVIPMGTMTSKKVANKKV